MPRLRHPEDGMVYACPKCGEAGNIYERDHPQALDGKPYRCYDCATSLEEVVERESDSPGNREHPRSPSARKLLEINVGVDETIDEAVGRRST